MGTSGGDQFRETMSYITLRMESEIGEGSDGEGKEHGGRLVITGLAESVRRPDIAMDIEAK